jgi:hypothetical protein
LDDSGIGIWGLFGPAPRGIGAWCFIGNFEFGAYLILGASLLCGKRRMKKVVIRGRSEDGYEEKASFCPEPAEESVVFRK